MSKPIEPGCLCLSSAPELSGTVTALYAVETGTRFRSFDGHHTTPCHAWACELDGHKVLIATMYLTRIDGFDGNEFEEAIGKMTCKEPVK